MTTGDRIKSLRLAKRMSQDELGQIVGVKKAAINKYETGAVINIKRSTIAKLAVALETTPIYLMGFEESETLASINESDRKKRECFIYEKLSKLSEENLAIALAQLDVLLDHQE